MSRRLLVVSEPADETLARSFAEGLGTVLSGATIDHFAPTISFTTVPAWLVRESRDRVDAANAVICLLGATSVASAWTTWAVNAGLDAEKRVVCVRLHNSSHDAPPSIVTERQVPMIDADGDAVAAFIERGEVRPMRAETSLPTPNPTPLATRLGRH